jgi:hypothetical protein
MKGVVLALLVLGLVFFGCASQQVCGNESDPVCGSDGVTYFNPCTAQQAKVNFTSGACVRLDNCTDSDNGRNLLETGFTKKGSSEGTDSCASGTSVQEYYCEKNELKVDTISCPSDMRCDKGKCVEAQCSDSDNGFKGEAKGTAIKGNQSKTDYCVSATSLKEYGCGTDGSITSSDISCNCVDGRCVTCTDSDNGKDTSKKGTVTSDADYTDTCTNTTTVLEYYCESGAMKMSNETCQYGFACINGTCDEISCADSDAGKNKDIAGSVGKGAALFNDSCYDGNTVREFYCYGGNVSEIRMDCDSGEVCVAGRCRTPACNETDAGYDPDTPGSITASGITRDDVCTNTTRLREYVCTDDGYNTTYVDCAGYFGTKGGACFEDACVRTSCNDTDGGKFKNVSGAVDVTSAEGFDAGWVNDVCINSRTVNEFYCSNGRAFNQTLACDKEQVCLGDKCIDGTCFDTDGGRNYTVSGSVSKGDRVEQDSCSSGILTEWFCTENKVLSEKHTCLEGCDATQRRCK